MSNVVWKKHKIVNMVVFRIAIYMMYYLIFVIVNSSFSYAAEEIIAGLDEKKDLPVLNEELRKLSKEIDEAKSLMPTGGTTSQVLTKDSATDYDTSWQTPTVSQSIKGWASITWAAGVPTLNDHYNVSGIVDDGAGKITITWDTDFASVNYCVVATPKNAIATLLMAAQVESIATGSVQISIWQQGGAAADPVGLYVMAIGD